ncbi:MAG: hypothetical protein ABI210_05455 [Abditibacteriaceae bacterium]
MLTDGFRVLNIDGSLVAQEELMRHSAVVVDLQDMARRLRFLSTRRSLEDFSARLNISQCNKATFIGSGDYHHLSAALIGQWRKQSTPLSVVVFDNHPDWDITSPWPCCGSWVNEILNFPFIRKVVVIGLGRFDLRGWHGLRGNTRAVRSGKLELYPVSWPRTKIPFAPDLQWCTLARYGLDYVMNRVVENLPTREIYLSIDKDCLRACDAFTNWEVGALSLDDLTRAVELLAREKEIVGGDIVGEYSRGDNDNFIFDTISRLNHPSQRIPDAHKLATNERTNFALLRALGFNKTHFRKLT